jgi:hypothetical protein
VRRAVIAGLLVSGVASAEEPTPQDPREAFGLPKQRPATPITEDDARDVFGLKRKPAEQVSCDDARTLGCTTATDPFDPVSPVALRTWLPASYLLRLPVSDARHSDVAHFATGAIRDDVGPAFAGATGLKRGRSRAPRETCRPATSIRASTRSRAARRQRGRFAARDRVSGGSIDVENRRGGKEHQGRRVDRLLRGATRAADRRSYQLRRITPNQIDQLLERSDQPSGCAAGHEYAAGLWLVDSPVRREPPDSSAMIGRRPGRSRGRSS